MGKSKECYFQLFILHPHSDQVEEKFCELCKAFMCSFRVDDLGKQVVFDKACTILRPSPRGIDITVKAQDVLLFHGILTLLNGCLSSGVIRRPHEKAGRFLK